MNVPSPLLDRLAQLLVLYEHLRIETFAVTEAAEESIDAGDTAPRVPRSIQRFAETLLEFDRALFQLSQTDEYRFAETNFENNSEMNGLMATVSNASRKFQARIEILKSLEERGDDEKVAPHSREGSAMPGDAGQSAARALAISRKASELSPDQIRDALCTIRDSFAQATEAIHALVAAFVRDRF
jgi:hypothetical protein